MIEWAIDHRGLLGQVRVIVFAGGVEAAVRAARKAGAGVAEVVEASASSVVRRPGPAASPTDRGRFSHVPFPGGDGWGERFGPALDSFHALHPISEAWVWRWRRGRTEAVFRLRAPTDFPALLASSLLGPFAKAVPKLVRGLGMRVTGIGFGAKRMNLHFQPAGERA